MDKESKFFFEGRGGDLHASIQENSPKAGAPVIVLYPSISLCKCIHWSFYGAHAIFSYEESFLERTMPGCARAGNRNMRWDKR